MCGSGGGSGGSGTQKYEWNDALRPHWVDALDYAKALKDAPYQRYDGQRIADFSGDQVGAIEQIRDRAWNQSDDVLAGREQARSTAAGDYLNTNPWTTATSVGANEYMGDSPQFRSLLQSGMEDITSAYEKGTSADTTRMFNLAGAFGGSAHQKAMADNQAALGKSLSNYTAGMQNDQYNRSAGLREADIGRNLQAAQFDKNLGSGAYENERGRMMGAVPLALQGQGLDFDRWSKLMGVGDLQQGHAQQWHDLNYSNWLDEKNYPTTLLDQYTGFLSRAQGGMAPNVTTSGFQPKASLGSQFLGAALAGKGLGFF